MVGWYSGDDMTDIEENMAELKMNFDTFVDSPKVKNCWVYERDLAVYVRRSIRFIKNDAVPCLDLASVEVIEEHRGMGIFTGFFQRFEEAAKKMNRAVFVESVLTPRFRDFFLKRGYKLHPHANELCPCLYKIV